MASVKQRHKRNEITTTNGLQTTQNCNKTSFEFQGSDIHTPCNRALTDNSTGFAVLLDRVVIE